MLSSSPPILPLHRQPSPLHFAMNASDPPSPPTPTSPKLSSITPSTSSSVPSADPFPLPPPAITRLMPASPALPQEESLVPIQPYPDSLLYRSTVSQLEFSATALKRLTKAVIAHAAVYTRILDELEKADDELCSSLGELGRWLEAGFGVHGSVWDDEAGVRMIRRGRYRSKREEMEAMIDAPVKAVRGDLKRKGLAGGGAQDRYEHFYQQTSNYLAQNPNDPPAHAQSTSSSSSSHNPALDAAQANRAVKFELARYAHHSALLFAVPPSSVSCLDLLVKMYTWAGTDLDATPSSSSGLNLHLSGSRTPVTPGGNRTSEPRTPEPFPPSLEQSSAEQVTKSSLAASLAKVAAIRANLLEGWTQRNEQTALLENQAGRRHSAPHLSPSPVLPGGMSSTPISSNGVEYKKERKMHKIHRSVGGKLRELLSPSGSTAVLADKTGVSERTPRLSIDSGFDREITPPRRFEPGIPEEPAPPPLPPKRSSIVDSALVLSPPSRPVLAARHSLQAPTDGYVSPFLPTELFPLTIESSSSPTIVSKDILGSPEMVASPVSAVPGRVMGVGGVSGIGDEDETREAVGRKKEGVLWGGGVWEELGKSGSKMKWEKFWVVLDRSRVYEYRDDDLERPESAHAVIDLKFASVREGRGTDRRFVFEIVTPTQGRRLYQATSDAEMKQWLYAICNAIESCINGTSSVRTFDASKLRTVSGSLDDHAVPIRAKAWPSGRGGLGLPMSMPTPPAGAGNRRSMPPMVTADLKRSRKTSLKKVLRQGAEMAGEKWSNVVNPRHSGVFDLSKSPQANTSRPSISSDAECIGLTPPPASIPSTSPASSKIRSDRSSWYEDPDGEIEKRVLEMAGLGLGNSPMASSSTTRRVQSESLGKQAGKEVVTGNVGGGGGQEMVRSRSAEVPMADMDMKTLRAVAEMAGNNRCADCGKRMKSSRWATLSLREVPMVMFLCIRCCGLHRGLGTHISKPRSVDLDIWTTESIRLALEWGNIKGNAVWEANKPTDVVPTDDDIAEYIKTKYVVGKWVAESERERFRLPPLDASAGIGRAI